MEIDRTKLLDVAYRHEVLVALVQGYQDHIFRYCAARLGEAHGEEVAQEVSSLFGRAEVPAGRCSHHLAIWHCQE
jgi:hypothetical protein